MHLDTGKGQHKYGMKDEKVVHLYREGTCQTGDGRPRRGFSWPGVRPRSLQKQSSCLERRFRTRRTCGGRWLLKGVETVLGDPSFLKSPLSPPVYTPDIVGLESIIACGHLFAPTQSTAFTGRLTFSPPSRTLTLLQTPIYKMGYNGLA